MNLEQFNARIALRDKKQGNKQKIGKMNRVDKEPRKRVKSMQLNDKKVWLYNDDKLDN